MTPPINPGSDVPPPQVSIAPGGLSSGAHAVHIAATIFTFGLWLPVYLIHANYTPKRHVTVTGTPEQVEAQLAAMQPKTYPIKFSTAEKIWLIGGGTFMLLLLLGTMVFRELGER